MRKLAMGLAVVLTLLAGCQKQDSVQAFSAEDAIIGFQDLRENFCFHKSSLFPAHEHEAARVSVQMEEKVLEYYSETDPEQLIFTQQTDFLFLNLPERPDVADAVSAALKQHRRAAQGRAELLWKMADTFHERWKEDPLLSTRNFYGFSFFSGDTVSRLDDRILSMITHESSYTGGPHPENRQYSQTFDLRTGSTLALSDVLSEEGETWLKKACLEWFQAHGAELGIPEAQYRDALEEKFSNAHGTEDCFWSFSSNGMVFSFNPDEIAPHAAGMIRIEIPFDRLEGVLLPAYFPETAERGEGGFFVQLGDTPAEGDFETTEFLKLHPQNRQILSVYGDGTALIPGISVSFAQKFGEQVLTQRVLYQANYLCSENRLCILLNPETDLDDLCIQYQNGDGETETVFFPPDMEAFLHIPTS